MILPAVYFALMFLSIYRRRSADGNIRSNARRAMRELVQDLSQMTAQEGRDVHAGLLRALRSYIGRRFDVSAASLTASEAEKALQIHGIDRSRIAQLKEILAQCEAGRYGAESESTRSLVQQVREWAQSIDRGVAG